MSDGQFVQHVIFRTNDLDGIRKLAEEFDEQSDGGPNAWLLKDRDQDGRYVISVVFPTYDEAMKNNDRPETQSFAAKMQALVEGDIEYRNYDFLAEL